MPPLPPDPTEKEFYEKLARICFPEMNHLTQFMWCPKKTDDVLEHGYKFRVKYDDPFRSVSSDLPYEPVPAYNEDTIRFSEWRWPNVLAPHATFIWGFGVNTNTVVIYDIIDRFKHQRQAIEYERERRRYDR